MKLQLTYPLQSVNISQIFGANPQIYSQAMYGGIKGHNGIDFVAGHGTPIYASHDGVAFYEYDGGQGEGVVLRTNDQFDDGAGGQCYYKTIYWHMCDPIKEPKLTSPVYKAVGFKPDQTGVSQIGWKVSLGDLIGYADNTGASTGDHLHFGLKPVAQGESNGAWYNTEQANGYNGAIDPQPFFDGSYPQQIWSWTQKISIMQKMIVAYQQLINLVKGTPARQ